MDFCRDRKLTLVSTVGMTVFMAARANEAGYAITAQDFFNELRLDPSEAPSKQAFADARKKILWQAYEYLLSEARRDDLETPWLGHRVRIADGTRLNTPNSRDLRRHFSIPNNKAGAGFFPQAWLVTLLNSVSGQPIAAKVGCHRNDSERDLMLGLLDACEHGDVVLLDRGLGGANVYLRFYERGLHFVHRVKTSGDHAAGYVQEFLRSKRKSQVCAVPVKADDGTEIVMWVRLVLGPIDSDRKRIVFATNLLDEDCYSVGAIRELYRKRWAIETTYGRVKNLLAVEKFHAKTYNGVMQEIFANLFVLSLTAIVATEAAIALRLDRAVVTPNFKAVLHVVRRHFRVIVESEKISLKQAALTAETMIEEAGRILWKLQPGRSYPRVSKQPIKVHNLCKNKKLAAFRRRRRKRRAP